MKALAILGILLTIAVGAITLGMPAARDVAMSVGVSSDGRYAVSAHRDNQLVLWNLEERSHQRLSERANIYSAGFVQGTDLILWQDLEDTVYVQRPAGPMVESFSHVPTYGHVMALDPPYYVSADIDWAVRVRSSDQWYQLKMGRERRFIGAGKVLSLSITGHQLVTSGFSIARAGYQITPDTDGNYQITHSPVLWDLRTGSPVATLPGNSSKTHATLSPDGQWAVSVCENRMSYLWDLDSQEQIYAGASLHHGIYYPESDEHDWYFDATGLIPLPDDFDARGAYIATKFISERYYLIFVTYSRYAVLFSVDSPLPVKYFDLGDDPFPAVSDYSRNLAIDTAPEAGILVMGQRDGSGILVYQFDPDELTLERVWVGR